MLPHETQVIKKVSEHIDTKIYWNRVETPPYYPIIEESIFNRTDIAHLLRSELIRKYDHSIPSFLRELQRNLRDSNPKSIAVLCGGSGALSHQLKKVFPARYMRIDNFDKSKEMLKADTDSTNCFCTDLSIHLKYVLPYDIVLCQGGLRYFSSTPTTLDKNLFTLINQHGEIFVGDNKEWIIDSFEKACQRAGYTTRRSKARIPVFRNTFAYFLYLEHIKDSQFSRIIKKECSNITEVFDYLIRLAGCKKCEYHYCYVTR